MKTFSQISIQWTLFNIFEPVPTELIIHTNFMQKIKLDADWLFARKLCYKYRFVGRSSKFPLRAIPAVAPLMKIVSFAVLKVILALLRQITI